VSETIQRQRLILPGDGVIAAVSGGVDSLVLLHGLVRLREFLPFTLFAATFDHGLRGEESAADAAYVQQIGAPWGVPVIVGRADVPLLERRHHLNREDAARRARYSFLVGAAQQVGAAKIATAHHQDDQAETVLLHLLHGSGLDGLAGMRLAQTLNESFCLPAEESPGRGKQRSYTERSWPTLIRPLLDVPRAEIEAYAAAHGIIPRADPTNQDTAYLRNFVRHQVLPLLSQRNPQISAGLTRLADVVRAEVDDLHSVADEILARMILITRPDVLVLDRAGWLALSLAEKRRVIRRAAARVLPGDSSSLTFALVDQVITLWGQGDEAIRSVGVGRQAGVWGGALIIAAVGADIADALWGDAAPSLLAGAAPPSWIAGERVRWTAGAWTFTAVPLSAQDELSALHADPLAAALYVPAKSRLTLRTRRAGDRFCPRGMNGQSQKLSDTLINMRVPALWRDRLPLLVLVHGERQDIGWWVAPTPDGVRARVGQAFEVIESRGAEGQIIVVRWQRNP
jgi:tRNA(Ile)-lysidine synthetase-like protein